MSSPDLIVPCRKDLKAWLRMLCNTWSRPRQDIDTSLWDIDLLLNKAIISQIFKDPKVESSASSAFNPSESQCRMLNLLIQEKYRKVGCEKQILFSQVQVETPENKKFDELSRELEELLSEGYIYETNEPNHFAYTNFLADW